MDEMKIQIQNAKVRMNRLINDLADLHRANLKGLSSESKADVTLNINELIKYLKTKANELKETYDL